MTNIIIAVGLVLLMISGCYLLSGSSLVAGTIFERKSSVKKKESAK